LHAYQIVGKMDLRSLPHVAQSLLGVARRNVRRGVETQSSRGKVEIDLRIRCPKAV